MRRLGDLPPVHPEDDVVLPDAGPEGGPARPHRLHEDGLVTGEGEPVALGVADHEQVPGEEKKQERMNGGKIFLSRMTLSTEEDRSIGRPIDGMDD